jgi:hypothetical protein
MQVENPEIPWSQLVLVGYSLRGKDLAGFNPRKESPRDLKMKGVNQIEKLSSHIRDKNTCTCRKNTSDT